MKQSKGQAEGTLPKSWTAIVVLASLVPAILTAIRYSQGIVTYGVAGDPAHDVVAEHALTSMMGYAMPQAMGLFVALIIAPFCFSHFLRTGELAPPLLGAGLMCVTMMDVFQVLAAQGLVPVKTATTTFIPLAWTLSRAFYAAAMVAALAGFLRSEKIRGGGQRRKATVLFVIMTLLIVAVGTALLYLTAGRPGLAAFLYAGSSLRMILNLAPIVILLLLAAYVLPVYLAWRRTVFAQTLLLSCVPLALAQLHFTFGFGDHTGFQFAMANILKLGAYLCPLLGLVLDYHHTYNETESTNRKLHNELFLAQQVQGVAHYERHALQGLFHALPMPSCFLDSSQNVTLMNEPFVHTNGIEVVDTTLAIGADDAFGMQAAKDIKRVAAEVIESGQAMDVAVRWLGQEQLEYPCTWHLHPISDGHGRTVAVVCLGDSAP